MSVVDALEEDGLLRYWGFSYGTILGQTLAAMFPDRIDRMILDGVGNVYDYYHRIETIGLAVDADAVFSGFCAGCVANPANCTLARNRTAAQLESDVYKYLDELKYRPVPISLPGGGFVLDYSAVKQVLHSLMYFPAGWPVAARLLDGAMTGNYTALYTYLAANSQRSSADNDEDSNRGIKCSDSFVRTSNFTEVLPEIQYRHNISRFFGDVNDNILMQCVQWGYHAKERYSGDFRVQTRHPLLVVNGRYDVVTAMVSARNATGTFEGSALLEWDGYGHTTLAQGSLCVARAIGTYFKDGTLPGANTTCEVAVPLFSGSNGWDEVLSQL